MNWDIFRKRILGKVALLSTALVILPSVSRADMGSSLSGSSGTSVTLGGDSSGQNQGGQSGDLGGNYQELAGLKDEAMKSYLLQRLVESQAKLNDAQANGIDQLTNYWRIVNEAAAFEFNRVRNETWRVAAIQRDIASKTELIKPMRHGEANSSTFWALGVFMDTYVPAYVVKETMSVKVDVLPASNFVANEGRRSTVVDFPGGDVGQLIEFMNSNHVSARHWSAAHYQLLGMLTAISTAAEEKIKELRTFMDGLRKGTIDVWNVKPPK